MMSILLHAIACAVILSVGMILGAILAAFLTARGILVITRGGKPLEKA